MHRPVARSGSESGTGHRIRFRPPAPAAGPAAVNPAAQPATNLRKAVLVVTLLASSCAAISAQRPIECTYVYGGEEKVVRIPPTADPYSVPLVELGDHLAWKAVYVAAPEELAVVSVYTYFLSEQGLVLIHQAKYRPPFPQAGAKGFTGVHAIYEPRNSGELQYWCGWAR